ncbi:MAG: hypothetical protein ACR2MN_00350 [Acidimicrobiales bacterium]
MAPTAPEPLPSDRPDFEGRRRRVVDDLGEGIDALARGEAVVLLTDPSSAPGALAAVVERGRAPVTGGGRLAVFVGEPSDPADRELATVMAEELFLLH